MGIISSTPVDSTEYKRITNATPCEDEKLLSDDFPDIPSDIGWDYYRISIGGLCLKCDKYTEMWLVALDCCYLCENCHQESIDKTPNDRRNCND